MSDFTPGIADPGSSDDWSELGGLDNPSGAVMPGVPHDLLLERNIWVVVVTLKMKNDPNTTATYYLSREYYDEGELFSGSPVIYPLLAGEPEDLSIQRGVGREVSILFEPEIAIYGKSALDDYGKSFFDLLQEYEIHEANVDVRCYSAAFGALTTDTAADVIQAGMKVRSFAWEGDVLSLGCRQVMFKDKEISKKLELETFPAMVEEWDQEYGSIAFGNNVIVAAPFINKDTAREADVFLSWVATGHGLSALNQFYARNTENPADDEWVVANLGSSALPTHGVFSISPFGTGSGSINTAYGMVYSPGPGASNVAFGVELPIIMTGTPSSDDGFLRIKIARAPSFAVSGVWIEERILRETVLDNLSLTTIQNVFAYIYPPLVMTPNENYLIWVEWSKPDATDGFLVRLLSSGNSENSQRRVNASDENWTVAANDIHLALYSFQTADSPALTDSAGSAPLLYSFYGFKCQTHATSVNAYSPNSDGKMHYGIELKADINGIKDDAGGTYTGSGSSVISRPADIIRFILLDDEIGINHGSGNVDTSTFTAARTAQAAKGLEFSFAIEQQTFASSLILRMLRYSMSTLYLKRDGKLGLRLATYSNTPTTRISQGQWEDEMDILAVADTTDDEIINEIELAYGINKLNPIRDRELTRRLGGTASYNSVTYIDGSGSDDSDTSRENKAANSIAKYGTRTLNEAIELFHENATGPTTLRNYWLDRWSEKQRRVIVRIPIIEFKTLDLFDTLKLSHKKLPSKLGTQHRVRWHNSGSEVQWYRNGIPTTWKAYGNLTGEIIDTRMQGDDVVITIETMSPF